MKKSALAVLLENKKEYTNHICQLLTEPIYVELLGIYTSTKEKVPDEKLLEQFQDNLSKIPLWNMDQVTALKDRIHIRMNCGYFTDLLKATFLVYMKLHMATLEEGNIRATQIKVKVPTLEVFLHRTLVATARLLWKKPYLMYHKLRSVDKQRNLMQCESYIHKAVVQTIQGSLPLTDIFQLVAQESHVHTSPHSQGQSERINSNQVYSDTDESDEEESDSSDESSVSDESNDKPRGSSDMEDNDKEIAGKEDMEDDIEEETEEETDYEDKNNSEDENNTEESSQENSSDESNTEEEDEPLENIPVNPILLSNTSAIGIKPVCDDKPEIHTIDNTIENNEEETETEGTESDNEEDVEPNIVSFEQPEFIKSLMIDEQQPSRKKSLENDTLMISKDTESPVRILNEDEKKGLQETLFNKKHHSTIHKPKSIHVKISKSRSKDAFF